MKRIVPSFVLVLVSGVAAHAQTPPPARPNVFPTLAACNEALSSGRVRFYEPKYFGLRTQNPTNNRDRVVVPLESDTCLEMLVVSGRRFVAQREGTLFRAQKLLDGSLAIYARDDCGNPVYGVVYPPPPVSAPPPQTVREPAIVVPPLVYRDSPPPPARPMFVEREKEKKGGFCSSKKCRLTVLVIAGGAGYATYRFWPCPPGTVRR